MNTSETPTEIGTNERTGDPVGQYSILPVVKTRSIDPGDAILIDVYLVGAGQIGDNQLDVIHEHPDLMTDEYGSIDVRIGTMPNGEIVTGDDVEKWFETPYDLNETGGKFSFAPRYFREPKQSIDPDETTREQPLAFPISYLDDRHDGAAPIRYSLATADDAPAGEYRVTLLFTYETAGVIAQDRQSVPIHVRTRRERYEPIPTYAVVGGTIIAFLTLLATALSVLVAAGFV